MPTSLTDLPTEALFLIITSILRFPSTATHLHCTDDLRDLNALIRTNHFFKALVTPVLHATALARLRAHRISLLHWAIEKRRPSTLQWLLSNGADPEMLTTRGPERSTEVCAVCGENVTTWRPPYEYTFLPLHLAASLNDTVSAGLLLDAGANVNACGDWDNGEVEGAMEPLWVALFSHHNEMSCFLLDRGADPNILYDEDGENQSALIWALTSDELSRGVVLKLIRKGADVEVVNEFGQYALLEAGDDPGIVQALVKAGADIDDAEAFETALSHGSVKAFLQAGFDLTANAGEGGKTWVHRVAEAEELCMARKSMVEDGYSQSSTTYYSGQLEKAVKVMQELLESRQVSLGLLKRKWWSSNSRGKRGRTAEELAKDHGNVDLARMIKERVETLGSVNIGSGSGSGNTKRAGLAMGRNWSGL